MEEGPRSKAVRVSRLQYCQYSYEKINLFTLLSDLVVQRETRMAKERIPTSKKTPRISFTKLGVLVADTKSNTVYS
jgi:hypothetical protein